MLKITPKGIQHQSFEYMVTRSELFMLREEGIIPLKAYMYFAISLDYPEGAEESGIDISAFCDRWEIFQSDFFTGIGFLSRKGIIVLRTKSLQMDSADRAERRTKAEIKRELRVNKQQANREESE